MDSTHTLRSLCKDDLIRIRTSNGGRVFGMFAGVDARHIWDAAIGEAMPERFARVVNRDGTAEIAVARISSIEVVLTDVERRAVSA